MGASSLTATGTYTQSAGSFLLAGGTVQSNNALNFQGGLVDARGTITAAIQNNALLRPALGGSGLNVTGNISLLSNSQLVFQLGGLTQGTQYGFLNVSGNVSLGGQLVVSFVNGFENSVANGNSFTVLSSTTALTGAFANVASGSRLTASNAAGSFLVSYNGNNIVLSDYSNSMRPAPTASTGVQSDADNSEPTELPEGKLPNGRVASLEGRMLGGRNRDSAREQVSRVQMVKVESSNQITDMLDSAEPVQANGKVVVDAKRAAKVMRGSGKMNANRAVMNGAGNTAGKVKTNLGVSGRAKDAVKMPSVRAAN